MRDALPITRQTAATPAARLILALGLRRRTTGEVQDLYSRPIVRVAGPAGRWTVPVTRERGLAA